MEARLRHPGRVRKWAERLSLNAGNWKLWAAAFVVAWSGTALAMGEGWVVTAAGVPGGIAAAGAPILAQRWMARRRDSA